MSLVHVCHSKKRNRAWCCAPIIILGLAENVSVSTESFFLPIMNALETSRWREKRGLDEVEALDTLDKTLAMKNPYGVVNPTADWSTQMSRDFPDASIAKLDTSKVVAQQLAKRSQSSSALLARGSDARTSPSVSA